MGEDEDKFLLPEALAPQRSPIGLIDIIKHAPVSELRAFYDSWYRPENMVVAVVGDIDPAAVEPELRRILGPVHAHGAALPAPNLGIVDDSPGLGARLYLVREASSTKVAIDSVWAHGHDADTVAFESHNCGSSSP